MTPFIIGSLGPVVYGVWSLANGIVGYLGLIDLGVRGSLGRFINYYLARDDNEGVNQVASTAAAFLIISAAVVCVGAVIVGVTFAELFPKTPAELVQQMALVLPLLAVGVKW